MLCVVSHPLILAEYLAGLDCDGRRSHAHVPSRRRRMLPISPLSQTGRVTEADALATSRLLGGGKRTGKIRFAMRRDSEEVYRLLAPKSLLLSYIHVDTSEQLLK